MTHWTILTVDDDPTVQLFLRRTLERWGYSVLQAQDCASALALFEREQPDAVVCDHMLPDGTALDLLPAFRALEVPAPVIVLTGHASIDLAVRAVKEGAENFLTKPAEPELLRVVLERSLENWRSRRAERAQRLQRTRGEIDPFLGDSEAIRRLADEARRVVSSQSSILIEGETGVGKGVLAAWLHRSGPRAEQPFVDLNCAGLSRELAESELFGHQRGAFTSADSAKMGLLEAAHRGVVFLDEIGDLDLEVQPKLLKVLEEKRFRRLGETRARVVDIQLIAATHQDLTELVREKRFRSDLYFRLSTIPLRVPPLRERRADILPLAHDLLGRLLPQVGRGAVVLTREAERALVGYSWPGNVRELRNVLERAALLADGGEIAPEDLRFTPLLDKPQNGGSAARTLQEVEIAHIERALAETRGSVQRAAAQLDVPRSTLYDKIRRFQIDLSSFG